MCAKPFPAVLIVSTLFEKTVGDPDPPSTGIIVQRVEVGINLVMVYYKFLVATVVATL